MSLVSKLLSTLKFKNFSVSGSNIEPITTQTGETYSPTVVSCVPVISSNDNLEFNDEGFPVNVTENAHFITKRNFTPSHVYEEPPFHPWAEQQRIKHLTIPTSIGTTVDVTSNVGNNMPSALPDGSIEVYNGYPILFATNIGDKIAINNRGDVIFDNNTDYKLYDENNNVLFTGRFKEVLNCDVYTRGKILNTQSVMLLV